MRPVRSGDAGKAWGSWPDLVLIGTLMFPVDWEKWKDFKSEKEVESVFLLNDHCLYSNQPEYNSPK